MQKICVAIWETGEWPEELTFSTFIPLPKKGDLNQCENYSVFQKKLDPLLFHHIFALAVANCMKISRSTQEMLLVVNME